jgi:FkbM family methyltransferase
MRTKIREMLAKGLEAITPLRIRKYFESQGSLKFQRSVQFGFLNMSYSQEGEDLIIKRYFDQQQRKLFWVDVGAHHPFRFSNTYIFYKSGGKGINIDATPGSMKLFNEYRSKDINLEIGISDKIEQLEFYVFKEQALNSFNKVLSEQRIRKGMDLEKVVVVQTKPLSVILDEFIPSQQEIDLLSIDAEGFDLKVLLSNNWSKYRPQIVLVESENWRKTGDEISDFLETKGYLFFAKTVKSVLFLKNGDK